MTVFASSEFFKSRFQVCGCNLLVIFCHNLYATLLFHNILYQARNQSFDMEGWAVKLETNIFLFEQLSVALTKHIGATKGPDRWGYDFS